jgi:hypothetical protein
MWFLDGGHVDLANRNATALPVVAGCRWMDAGGTTVYWKNWCVYRMVLPPPLKRAADAALDQHI